MSTPPSSPIDINALQGFIDNARLAGVEGAEIIVTAWDETSYSATNKTIEQNSQRSGISVIGMVYLLDGRAGAFKTKSTTKRALAKALATAIETAESAAASDVGKFCLADKMDINERGMGVLDPRYKYLDNETREELAEINTEAAERVGNIEYLKTTYRDRLTHRAYLSTNGIKAVSSSTLYNYDLTVKLLGNPTTLSSSHTGRAFAHIGTIPFGNELTQRLNRIVSRVSTIDALGHDRLTRKRITVTPPLVLTPIAMSWLIEAMAPVFSAKLEESESFLSRIKDGNLGNRTLHIIDDPGLHGGVRTRAFDDRGVPPTAIAMVLEGKANAMMHTPESARLADTAPTGHLISRKLSPSNLLLRAGNRSRTQMLSEVPNSLEIDHFEGKLNLKTGKVKISGPALLLSKGQKIGFVGTVTIDLEIWTLFKAIKEVASNQERHGAVDSATVLLGEIPYTLIE
jgi:predicted Zn-dependent protease